jgi:hypothetical protein
MIWSRKRIPLPHRVPLECLSFEASAGDLLENVSIRLYSEFACHHFIYLDMLANKTLPLVSDLESNAKITGAMTFG